MMANELYQHWLEYIKTQKKLRETPKGYEPWELYLAQWTHQINNLLKEDASVSADEGKLEKEEVDKHLAAICHSDIPPRYVSQQMCLAWVNTKAPVIPWNKPYVLPGFVLFAPVPPIKEFRAADEAADWRDGETLSWISAMSILDRPDGLDVATLTTHYTPKEHGSVETKMWTHTLQAGENYNIKDKEAVLFNKIASYAINAWLIHAHEPSLIRQDAAPARSGTGFGAKRQCRSPIAPTWIGRDFKVQRLPSPATPAEARIPVRPHWRSGHWHTVRHGKGREHERLQWYRPVYVNADTAA